MAKAPKILYWYPTAVVRCPCGAETDANLIILIGFENAAPCGVCGDVYIAHKLNDDGTLNLTAHKAIRM